MTKPLLIESTGTPYGISRMVETAWKCRRKVWLSMLEEEAREEMAEAGMKLSPPDALLTGSIGHALLAEYYKGEDPLSYTPYCDAISDDIFARCADKATHAIRGYMDLHSRDEFGEIVCVEERVDLKKGNPSGLYPYSFRPDLVVRVGKQAVEKVQATRGVTLSPGVWLVEHKFVASANQTNIEKYLHSTQVTSYLEAWNAAKPDMQARGVIINLVVKTKITKTVTAVRWGNNAVDLAVLRSTIAKAKEHGWPLTVESPEPPCNPEQCWDFRVCRFFASGQCRRF